MSLFDLWCAYKEHIYKTNDHPNHHLDSLSAVDLLEELTCFEEYILEYVK